MPQDPLTPSPASDSGARGLSEALHRFTAEMPWERESILAFVAAAARATAPGARVLDVGAGDAPYRELFAHAEYETADWEHSVHEDAQRSDHIAPADRLPHGDAEVDVLLCTQVLEHVPDPGAVLAEFHRILRPGGRVYVTAPLVWELHELPHDYFRYTQPGLEHLLAGAGFDEIDVQPRNDCFTTVAQLLRNLGATMGRAPDGLDERREQATQVLAQLADQIAELAPLDARRVLPLGFVASAVKPSA
jgi:SAM-dependent methyltransferase